MKLCLIGGSGFIGSNLINILPSEQYQIHNLDKQITVGSHITHQVDIRDFDALEKNFPHTDWVIHLAAEHTDNVDPTSLYYDVNVQGTQKILDVMRKKGNNRIIFTSSVAVYGLNKENPTENSPLDPFNHYGKSKAEAEKVLLNWYNEDKENRTLIIVRPTVVFGPGNRGNVYNLLQQIASGKFLMIGNGKNKKSMAYVGNIVAFIKHCITSNLKGLYLFNYADKPDLTTKELIQLAEVSLSKKISPLKIPYALGLAGGIILDIVSKFLGKSLPISRIRVKKFCATTQFSSINIHKTNFIPPYTLQEGLNVTMNDIIKTSRHTVEEDYQ